MGRILFDLVACQSNGTSMNHGGKEYGEAVFCEMMKQKIPLSCIYNSKLELNEQYLNYCKGTGEVFDTQITSLQDVIETHSFSVFYSALPYALNNMNWHDTTFIGNIHGLRPIEAFTDRYEYKYSNSVKGLLKAFVKSIGFIERKKKKKFLNRIGEIINNPSFVCLTGSDHSKFTLLNYYPSVKPERIAVFYDPLNLVEVDQSYNKSEKYYLLVSGNRWLKNTYRGIIALDQLISSGRLSDSKIVVTGTIPNMMYLKDISNVDKFIFKSYVTPKELALLYKNAYCLVFLSLSEGFGYPPLEAISRGTPVVCSPLTALYEVYQNSVLYCNPYSIDDIKVKILEMEDEIIYNTYRKRGLSFSKEMIEKQKDALPRLVEYICSYAKD